MSKMDQVSVHYFQILNTCEAINLFILHPSLICNFKDVNSTTLHFYISHIYFGIFITIFFEIKMKEFLRKYVKRASIYGPNRLMKDIRHPQQKKIFQV